MSELPLDGPGRQQRKLRAGERRDNALAMFCDKMVKLSRRSDSPAARRDAGYWADLARYYRGSQEISGPVRKWLPNTRRLEFLERAADTISAERAEEVAQLRAHGVPWQVIADAIGITRQAATSRWKSLTASRVTELMSDAEQRLVDQQFNDILAAGAAAELESELGMEP